MFAAPFPRISIVVLASSIPIAVLGAFDFHDFNLVGPRSARVDPALELVVQVSEREVPEQCWVASPDLSGTAQMRRYGDKLRLTLNGVAFTGAIEADGVFHMTLVEMHSFDWSDGCRWHATDALIGRLTDTGWEAQHQYREWPVGGASCAGACSFTSRLVGTNL